MTNKYLLALTIAFATTISVNAEKMNVEEPEWAGDIVYANETTGKGLPLERQQASVRSVDWFMGNVTTVYTVKGEKSPVRIRKNSSVQFIYRAKSNEVNPKDVIQIVKFTVKAKKKSDRKANIKDQMPFEAVKYGKSSYLITLKDYLPSEYGFALGSEVSKTLYLFGIDE